MNIRKLKEEQIKLAKKVQVKDAFMPVKRIGGCDIAVYEDTLIACVVVCDYKSMEIVEQNIVIQDSKIEYIPGYLSYREAPPIVEAFMGLKDKPEVLLVDANGILHPRKIGAASHLGILLDQPTIGVAKKLMCGEVKDGKVYYEGEVRGIKLFTKEFSNPIYISPGHKVNVTSSVKIVKQSLRGHKMPEPLHLAHKIATKKKHKIKETPRRE